MSSDTALRDAILTRFKAQWDTLEPAVPVAYDGFAFTPPADGTEWVRVTVMPGQAQQASLSGPTRRWRTPGVVTVQVFVPKDKGTDRVLDLIGDIRTALQGVTLNTSSPEGSVALRATSDRRVGPRGNYYQRNAETPFRFDYLA